MWIFGKKNYSVIFQQFDECGIKYFSNYNIEQIGMFYNGELHGYGCIADHKNMTISFGIFKNGKLYKNLGHTFHNIQRSIGKNSKMISTRVFGSGVYIGEGMSPAGYNRNFHLRKERYGIMILKSGMYVGTFPPGYFLTHCDGSFYNLEGKKLSGDFDIEIIDNQKCGNDSLGDYLPSY